MHHKSMRYGKWYIFTWLDGMVNVAGLTPWTPEDVVLRDALQIAVKHWVSDHIDMPLEEYIHKMFGHDN